MKKIISVCLALLLVLSCVSAQAAAQVNYEGGAEKFVFLPGSTYSDSDLFESFKQVMPGDVLTQRINVRKEGAHLPARRAGGGTVQGLPQPHEPAGHRCGRGNL